MKILISLLFIALLSGCASRAIYVPEGQSVRLGQNVKAKVWVKAEDGNTKSAKMKIPEGWYCLSK